MEGVLGWAMMVMILRLEVRRVLRVGMVILGALVKIRCTLLIDLLIVMMMRLRVGIFRFVGVFY